MQEYKIGEIAKLKYGKGLTEEKREADGYPVYSSAGIVGYYKHFLAKKGIVVGRKGNAGSVYFSDVPFYPIDTTFFIDELSKDQDIKFFFYLLKTINLKNFEGDAAVPGLNRNVAESLKVSVPPYETQKKIAAVLSAYDDLIENNKRRIALLEKMAEEIYREWFVRMRFPGYKETKFEKGVPVGWEITRLDEILELSYGKSLKSEERIDGEFPVYGSSGIVGTHNKALVKDAGIIVGRKGNVGSVHWSDKPFFPIDTVYFVKSSISNYFLLYLLKSLNFINNDAAVPGLNRNQAYSNKFFFPKEELINAFSDKAEKISTMKSTLNRKTEILENTRNMLLSRLISGKLSVENLDIQFPPSMREEEEKEEMKAEVRQA